jgi:hypothetical protein
VDIGRISSIAKFDVLTDTLFAVGLEALLTFCSEKLAETLGELLLVGFIVSTGFILNDIQVS